MDYYKFLNVDKSATQEEISKAYKKLCREYHPDKYQDEKKKEEMTKKFQQLQEIYDTLNNPEKRRLYDLGGKEAVDNGGVAPDMNDIFGDIFGNIFGGNSRSSGFEGFADMFGGFGGGGRKQKRQVNIPPKTEVINITLKDVYNGKKMSYELNKKVLCGQCSGYGTKNKQNSTCPNCNGSGMTIRVIRQGPMIQQFQTQCERCRGSGIFINESNKCSCCKGSGQVPKKEKINITINPGIKDEDKITLNQKGDEHLIDGTKYYQDIIFIIKVSPHSVFNRINHYDLYIEKKINIRDALVGFMDKIKFLDDKDIIYQTKTIINNGDIKIISGKGLPKTNSSGKIIGYGNLHIKFIIKNDIKDLSKQKDELNKIFDALDIKSEYKNFETTNLIHNI